MNLSALLVLFATNAGSTVTPYDLRCEALTDPMGIDRTRPSLSWKLQAARPGLRNLAQKSYRILVASDPARLAPGKADIWDSKPIASKETYGIEYAGRALRSDRTYWWKVAVGDQNGNTSAWSRPAKFSLGLLSVRDWKAKWIAIDAPDSTSGPFTGASWIWSAGDAKGNAPKGQRTFTRGFSLPRAANLQSARMTLTVDDQFTLWVNGKRAAKSDGKTDAWRRPVTVDLKSFLRDGQNELQVVAENAGPGHAGFIGQLVLQPRSGAATRIVTNDAWREEGGKAVQVLGPIGTGPWSLTTDATLRPATYYRTDFSVKPRLTRAVAYVTALGLVDVHLNGQRIAEDLFTPGWSDYDKRVYYRAYDVTKNLRAGANAVGAILGDGWYSGYVGYGHRRAHYGDRPRVRVQLNLEYADGTKQTVASSENWRANTGPIREQDFLAGEVYDARMELAGWDRAGYPASGWKRPYTVDSVKIKVEAFPAQPVLPYERRSAKTIKTIRPGVYILDYAQNLAGFARLKVRGTKGQRIVLRFAEKLNPDGTLYTTNLRGARAIDTYICKGSGVETWEPRFTFHGFQYVEVSGLTAKPKLDDVQAVAISSATPEVGHIETSDKMLNQLSSNAWWTQKMNFIDVPTDCPQRDERLGWTGDAQAYIRTAASYSDVQAFFTKWLVALDDGQRADGQFPQVAPNRVAGDDGGPAWADAGVICPWTIYNVYGDRRQLAEHYPAMKRFVEFCRKRSTPDLLPPANFHCFGDWLSIKADTPKEVIYQAYFATSAKMLSEAAVTLGYRTDAAEYANLAQRVRASFNRAYVSPEGVVKGNTQCGYVLALAFDLLDETNAKKAAKYLVDDIEARGWHLSTGFVGTRDLMQVLSKIGRNDVAFRLLHNTTFPSWGFEIVNGATTVWERWDGWTPERGFQDPGMNSFAHYAYGAVMGWVYSQIGGIDHVTPGFAKILIAPQIDPKLTWAKTRFDSVRGPIATDWRVAGGKLTLTVEVPPNAVAEIRVPVSARGKVTSDLRVTGRREKNAQVFNVGSGTYRFAADR